jgi:hypothetical protein
VVPRIFFGLPRYYIHEAVDAAFFISRFAGILKISSAQ